MQLLPEVLFCPTEIKTLLEQPLYQEHYSTRSLSLSGCVVGSGVEETPLPAF